MGMISDVHELGPGDHRVSHLRVYDSTVLAAHIESVGLRVVDRRDVLFKVLSNEQMQSRDSNIINGLFAVVRHFPGRGN